MDTKALRQKILDLAIRGKLVPQDPNEEPASVLLEKIRAEKQQMVKDGRLKTKDIKNDTIIFKGEDSLHYEKFQDGSVKCIEDEIPFELPEGWAWCRLNKLFHVCSAKRVRQSDWREEGVPFYRAREIVKLSDNGFVENELFISEEHYIRVKEECGVPQSGDLMVSGVGTIGKIYIVNETDCFYYKDASVLCFENRTGIVNPEFARILLESSFLQAQMKDNSKGTTVDTITISAAMNYLCLLPPLKEQENIVQAVKNACIYAEEIQNNKDNLQILISKTKSQILDLAIRGKLVPQDPNDESASVLLERIRTEKEELIKQGKIKRDKKESVIFKGEDNSYYEKFSDGKCHCIDDELPFELPDGWEWCNLSMIGTTNIGLTYSPADIEPDGTIVLRSSNIVNDEIDLNDLVRVKTKIRENQYVQPNDILICARNGSKALVGKCALVNNLEEPTSFGAFMAIYRTNYNKYVMHYLRTSLFRSVFNDGNSTAINQLTQDMLKKALIPFPPILEQEKIVNVASKLFIHLHGIEKSLN